MIVRLAESNGLQTLMRLHHLVRQASMPYLPVLHTIDEASTYFTTLFQDCSVQVAETDGTLVGLQYSLTLDPRKVH